MMMQEGDVDLACICSSSTKLEHGEMSDAAVATRSIPDVIVYAEVGLSKQQLDDAPESLATAAYGLDGDIHTICRPRLSKTPYTVEHTKTCYRRRNAARCSCRACSLSYGEAGLWLQLEMKREDSW